MRDYLQLINQIDENEFLEAKTASEISQPILKTVCAFANGEEDKEHVILLGIAKDINSQKYEVVGVDDPDKLSVDLATKCRGCFNRALSPEIIPVLVEGKTYLVVKIIGIRNAEKPVYLKKLGKDSGVYKRIGSSTQKCSDEDYRKFIQASSLEDYDVTCLPDSDMDDISDEALAEYRKARKESHPNAPELEWDDKELLHALNAIKKDRNGIFRLTISGLMLFGKPSALRRLRPMEKVDYIRIQGKNWVEDSEKRFASSLEIRDYLFKSI